MARLQLRIRKYANIYVTSDSAAFAIVPRGAFHGMVALTEFSLLSLCLLCLANGQTWIEEQYVPAALTSACRYFNPLPSFSSLSALKSTELSVCRWQVQHLARARLVESARQPAVPPRCTCAIPPDHRRRHPTERCPEVFGVERRFFKTESGIVHFIFMCVGPRNN